MHDLLEQGVGLLECSRRLGWGLNTVKRVYLDVTDVDWTEISEIVTDAYRQVAPRKLVARVDSEV